MLLPVKKRVRANRGAKRTRRLIVEVLEDRRLLSVTPPFNGGHSARHAVGRSGYESNPRVPSCLTLSLGTMRRLHRDQLPQRHGGARA